MHPAKHSEHPQGPARQPETGAAINNDASADAIARGNAVAAATGYSEQTKLLTPGSEPLAGGAAAERSWRRNRRGMKTMRTIAKMRYASRRIGGVPALVTLVTVAGVLAGCGSSGPSTFTSQTYGYTVALPAGWSGHQASYQWNGGGAPSHGDGDVDLFSGPGSGFAIAFAAPSRASLAAYVENYVRDQAAEHPCPPNPQTNQAVTIDRAPARLLGMHCPAPSDLLVLNAITVHDQTGYVFVFEDPSGGKAAAEHADRLAFRKFLAGIRFPQ
jgi:hypothetical protein